MHTAGKLARDTARLTAASLGMSLIGLLLRMWLARHVGAAGIGLYALSLSAANLFATFAVSGVRFAATRLVAEELERGGGARRAMRPCLVYGAVFGCAAGLLLWLLAEPLAADFLGDGRAALSLRLSALSMPCIALSAALSGYYLACGQAGKTALAQLFEQAAGALLTVLYFPHGAEGGLELSCAAMTRARVGADVLALGLLLGFYLLIPSSGAEPGGSPSPGLTGRLLRLALPLAASAYARSALGTLRHVLVPRGLRAYGQSVDGALAQYGVLQGMTLPLLLFPSCVLSALSSLLVPELTRAQLRQDRAQIKNTAGKLIRLSLLYSLAVAMFLFLTADALGMLLWHSAEAGRYLRLLAPLVPVMYADIVVDGCLKGLGQQVWSMGINLLDAALGLLLVWQLLPRYGLAAYPAILAGTELLNAALSLWRLLALLREPPASPEAAARRSPARRAQRA